MEIGKQPLSVGEIQSVEWRLRCTKQKYIFSKSYYKCGSEGKRLASEVWELVFFWWGDIKVWRDRDWMLQRVSGNKLMPSKARLEISHGSDWYYEDKKKKKKSKMEVFHLKNLDLVKSVPNTTGSVMTWMTEKRKKKSFSSQCCCWGYPRGSCFPLMFPHTVFLVSGATTKGHVDHSTTTCMLLYASGIKPYRKPVNDFTGNIKRHPLRSLKPLQWNSSQRRMEISLNWHHYHPMCVVLIKCQGGTITSRTMTEVF